MADGEEGSRRLQEGERAVSDSWGVEEVLVNQVEPEESYLSVEEEGEEELEAGTEAEVSPSLRTRGQEEDLLKGSSQGERTSSLSTSKPPPPKQLPSFIPFPSKLLNPINNLNSNSLLFSPSNRRRSNITSSR